MGKNGSGKSTLAQVLAGREAYEVTRAGHLQRQGPARAVRRGARPRRRLPRVPISGRDPRRQHQLLPQGGRQRRPQASRRDGAGRGGVPQARQGEDEAAEDGPQLHEPRRQRRLLRRRKEAQRDLPDGRHGSDARPDGRDRFRAGHRCAARPSPKAIDSLRRPDNAILVVTHYQRLLNYIVPDVVHVMLDGRIVKTGGKDLAMRVEAGIRLGRERSRTARVTDLMPRAQAAAVRSQNPGSVMTQLADRRTPTCRTSRGSRSSHRRRAVLARRAAQGAASTASTRSASPRRKTKSGGTPTSPPIAKTAFRLARRRRRPHRPMPPTRSASATTPPASWSSSTGISRRSCRSSASLPRGVARQQPRRGDRGRSRRASSSTWRSYADIEANPFVALNTGFIRDGAYVHLPRGATVEQPIHLLFISTPAREPAVSHPRVLVVAEDNVAGHDRRELRRRRRGRRTSPTR